MTDFVVRRVQPYQAVKTYRCPGCDQEISPGTGHVVAWREGAEDARRHWHAPCWDRREDRLLPRLRGHSAPRY